MLNRNKSKVNIRLTVFGADFAERFKCSIRDLLKRPVFERGDAGWIDVLPKKTKQHNKKTHFSYTLTPIQACLKKNEGFFVKIYQTNEKKLKPKLY